MKKRIFKGTGLILLLLVLFVLSNAVVITRANEYVLIKQFGKVVQVEENAGPSLCIPFLQTVQRVPKYKMISDLYPSDVTTKDKKVMTVDSFVIWDISDPVKMCIRDRPRRRFRACPARWCATAFSARMCWTLRAFGPWTGTRLSLIHI